MLRYYQQDAVNAVYGYFQHNASKNPCVVLPTGAGKTHVIVKLCQDVNAWGGRVLVLAHVKELLEQAASKLSAENLDVGIYSASLNKRDKATGVVVAGVQSIYKRGYELTGTSPFNLVIVDECHRIPLDGDGMYRQLLGDLKTTNPKIRIVGLTATPYRTGDGYVCSPSHFLNEICYEVSVKELIDGGFLCPLSSKRSILEVSMDGVRISGGDYVQADMENRFAGDDNVRAAVQEIAKLTSDRKKVLIFCCGIQHAIKVGFYLDELGCKARIVTSQHGERTSAVDDFKSGGCKYLANVNCLTEGFDSPNIDCVVLLRSTMSPGLYYQMVGRGLRLSESKSDCLILDYGGNIKQHGTIDCLVVKDKSSGSDIGGEAPVKPCPGCNEMIHAGLMTCSDCGYEFPKPPPKHEPVASADAPLQEIAVEEFDVTDVTYNVHIKRGQPDAPRSMRVSYWNGASTICDEWICVEHTGFAFDKASSWWKARSNSDMPKSAEDAVELANSGAIAKTTRIRVRSKTGERFKTVIGYEYGPKPEAVLLREPGDDGDSLRDDTLWNDYLDSDIPF